MEYSVFYSYSIRPKWSDVEELWKDGSVKPEKIII